MPTAPSEGGRNYLRGTSDEYQTYTNTNYILGYPSTYRDWTKLLDPLRDKTVTVRAYIKNDTDYPVRVQIWFTRGGIYGNTVAPHSEGWSVKTGKMSADWTSANVALVQEPGTAPGGTIHVKEAKVEISETATPYSQAPEDLGWSVATLVPTQSNRYLWKFEYVYYSDGSVEITQPVNLSIAGDASYTHFAYCNITKLCNESASFTLQAKSTVRYGFGDKWVYKTLEAGTYTASNVFFGGDPYSGKIKQCELISSFSLTDSTSRNWLGTYSDNNTNAVANPSYFTWQLTKGADGTNGQTSHVHFAFADNATGGGFSLTTPKAYMGWYADFNETASNDPTKYKWGKWKGDQGVRGDKGDDGKTSYLHLAYASSADGKTGFSFTDTKQQYQGYYTDFTQTSSTDPTKYTWMDRQAHVKVSGINLLRKTKKFDWSNFYGSSKLTGDTYQGCAIRYLKSNNATSGYQEVVQFTNCIYPTLGGEYVASFWAKGSGTFCAFFYGGNGYLQVAAAESSQGSTITSSDGRMEFTLSEDWQRYWIKYKLKTTPASAASVGKHFLLRHNANGKEEEIWVAGCKLEEATIPTPYSEAPEDTQEQIDSKADQALTQEQLNALAEKNRNMEAEMAAKASLAEVERWKQAYDEYVAQNDADKTSAEQKLITLTSRVAEWVKDWEDKKVQWSFLDTNMDFGEEGLRLGKKGSPTSILISNDRIGFYSGGSEVASMSNGTLTIDNGIFAKSLQIGHYREEVYEGDKTINVIRWID